MSEGMAMFVAGTGIWSWQDLAEVGRVVSVAGEIPVITESEAESLAWPLAGGYLNFWPNCFSAT